MMDLQVYKTIVRTVGIRLNNMIAKTKNKENLDT